MTAKFTTKRFLSLLTALVMAFAGLGLGALPAEAATKGKIRVTVSAPKGVKAKVTVSKKGAKSFSVTKKSSKKSAKKTRTVKTGTWKTKAQFVKKDGNFYVAKKTKSKVKKNKTKKVTVKFKKAKVATKPKEVAATAGSVTLEFQAANKKYPVQVRHLEGDKAPKTVKQGKKTTVTKGSKTATVAKLKPNTTYSFSLFTKVNGIWVGPVSLTKVKTYPGMSRMSVASTGATSDKIAESPSVSGDGRYVAFSSRSLNLAEVGTSGASNIYVHDRRTGETSLITKGFNGPARGGSYDPVISRNGRYVAYRSIAPNLVPGVTGSAIQIYVHDRQTGETKAVSRTADGTWGSGSSGSPSISDDGNRIAFVSAANNLVPSDDNGKPDVFVRDMRTGAFWLVSISRVNGPADGESANPSISADGNLVAFESLATNLVIDDTNWERDVFVRDLTKGQTKRLSVATGGGESNDQSASPSISADGKFVAFESEATNLDAQDQDMVADIYIHELKSGRTSLVSMASGVKGNRASWSPSLSGDGRHLAFVSHATNLVAGDINTVYDVFVLDRRTGRVVKANVDNEGRQSEAEAADPSISSDGGHVAFVSDADDLGPGHVHWDPQVFIWSRR